MVTDLAAIISAFAIGLMVIVLLIAIFSLFVLATIPVGRFMEKRAERATESDLG